MLETSPRFAFVYKNFRSATYVSATNMVDKDIKFLGKLSHL